MINSRNKGKAGELEAVPDKYKELAEQIKEELDYSASYTQVFTPKKEI